MLLTVRDIRNLISEELLRNDLDKYVSNNADLFPAPGPGKTLGGGGDGNVYGFIAGSVMKVGSVPEASWGELDAVLTWIESTNPPNVVTVYSHDRVGTLNNEVVYYYVTQKLSPLSQEESKAIKNHVFAELVKGKTTYVPSNVSSTTSDKVNAFFDRAKELKFQHLDIQPANIMRDRLGNLKFIDIESFIDLD
jgi:serine/threonine protein kinase